MGTVVHVLFGILAALVLAAFIVLFYAKLNALDVSMRLAYAYKSRHAEGSVNYVPRTWIPRGATVRYREMWRARIEGTADFLRVPIDQLEACYQRALAERLSNWNWLKVPSQEWPRAWQGEM